MSSTSRILRAEEHSSVKPVWWQDTSVPGANHPPTEVVVHEESIPHERSGPRKTP